MAQYAVTELLETEREYCKAIKPLADLLNRLQMELVIPSDGGPESTVQLPNAVCNSIQGLRTSLRDMMSFSERILLDQLTNCLVNPQQTAECFTKHFEALSHYTHYLIHLENMIKGIQALPGFETDGQFPLTPPVSSNGDFVGADATANESNILWSQRTSISFRYLLELADLPRIRLVAYRGLLRDLARYTARAESDTQDLEQAMICVSQLSRRAEEGVKLWQLIDSTGGPHDRFKELFYNAQTDTILPPALIRLTDLKINERQGIKVDTVNDQTGRLVLLPGHLLFLQKSSPDEKSAGWKICWMHPVG
ncbi:unnamed protein product [Echinostoma caproni]|uniref:DH domain-containing protein n=1 Tax=Echinostoma caproni TaxID=27848 RepID=A0A183AGT6_9TREM|nr:unnamed protein product [Echinostoma caproni]